jgi:4-amino-4-deoxy-L-arabinose transferase-like glycosyltransferase
VGAERAMTIQRFTAALSALVLLGLTLRVVYPTADPPWNPSVGVVWHDEGAWVHNARNRALFGAWRLDEWNPVFIAPVFTAVEYASFAALGVGVRQARLVSELAGLASIVLLAFGVRRVAGDGAALMSSALMATNYVYVMYDRAAIMEALMAAFLVVSWYCSTRAEQQPAWGSGAGAAATLAFFTKAAAAFYIAALGMTVAYRLWETRGTSRAARWTIAGLTLSFAAIAAFFVAPHWADYRFYNWQVSVTRKPSYALASMVMRISWFPILHDTFSRMWPALVLGVAGAWGIVLRWRRSSDAERLLLLWVAVGSLELVLHDVGSERRFIFLVPPLIALASLVLSRGALLPAEAVDGSSRRVLVAAPLICYSLYVVCGPMVRVPFLSQVRDNVLHAPVRISAALAVVLGFWIVARWPRLARAWSRPAWTGRSATALVVLLVAWDLAQFTGWAVQRTYKNYEASIALGRVLPPGTLVQGKLANGLDLENQLRPIFIGHGFGNFADRKHRDDVRYILTYTDPRIGYEGDQIRDVLDAYPGWHIVMAFDVAESSSGHDRAALIEKRARH